MGACNIEFSLKGKASRSEIQSAFDQRVQEDAAENGHQHGYSGDFQTVDKVDFKHLGTVFPDINAAEEYALDHAEKWSTVVAVYFEGPGGVCTLVAGWGAC
jgi:hypothetical protein